MSLTSSSHILTQHFDSSEFAFKKIDEEVTALRGRIRALHSFRNTFTPIYRLPPEILTRIFSFISRTPVSPEPKHFYSQSPSHKWLVATRVSQRWRNVALGSPTLWAHISNSYPEYIIKELLQRSKAAPLSVRMHAWMYVGSSEDAHLIRTTLHRIRDLDIDVDSSVWNTFWSNRNSPAPLLESLKISISGQSYTPPVKFSDSVFAGTTPRLRCLEITGATVDLESSIFKDLTVLELKSAFQKVAATDLLTTIRKLPGLISLKLIDLLHKDAAPLSSTLDVISLPCLKSLHIGGQSFVQDLDILSHLSFPENTTLRLFSQTQNRAIVPVLLDFLRVEKTARLRESPLSTSSSFEVEVSKYSLVLLVHAECSESDYLTQITEVHLSLPCTGEYLITPGLSGNPEVTALLSPLVSFTISDYLDVTAWANIFGSLPNLTHIHATEPCAATLLSAIIDDCKGQVRAGSNRGDMSSLHGTREIVEGTREGGGQPGDVTSTSQFQPSTGWVPIFPQLEVIHISDTTFPESLVDLVYALTARKIAGKGIETLRITGCRNMDYLTFDVLGICVDELVWDREVLAEPEPEDEDEDDNNDHSESEYY